MKPYIRNSLGKKGAQPASDLLKPRAGEVSPPPIATELTDAMERYLVFLQAEENKSPLTVENYRRSLDLVAALINVRDPKDIDISIVGNTLTIKGERKVAKEAKKEDYLFSEVRYGSFERVLTLPEGVRADNIHASYKNGILEVTMPAAKAALPKKVAIEVEGTKEELRRAV